MEQFHPSAGLLRSSGIPRAAFCRWHDPFQAGGPEALADRPSRPARVWSRIPDEVRAKVIELALEQPELSPRELAARFTDEHKRFVSEASAYRLLKARDLTTSPAWHSSSRRPTSSTTRLRRRPSSGRRPSPA